LEGIFFEIGGAVLTIICWSKTKARCCWVGGLQTLVLEIKH